MSDENPFDEYPLGRPAAVDFPADRYVRAGASPEQIAELEALFVRLPEAAQRSEVARLAGIADYDLAAELAPAPEPEPPAVEEPADATPEPTAETETEASKGLTFSDGSTI